jgi:hypothetical protein
MTFPFLHRLDVPHQRIGKKHLTYWIGGALALLFPFQLLADVEVWTDREKVILKGDLKGLKVLPSGTAKKQPRQVKRKPSKAKRKPIVSKKAGPRAPTTLRVGPKQRLKWPSLAAMEAQDGDTIEIAAGEYVDCTAWRANNLTIRGVGGRAHIRDETCEGKAIWITKGNNTTIENIEFSGMKVRDKNGAGIRHEGVGLTIKNAYFHDGEQGILSGGGRPRDTMLIEDSEFARLGKVGQAHAIYIAGEKLTVRRNYFHSCVDEGHCVKSRAKHTILSCNVIASLEGNSSFEVDFPNGGRVEVRNNIIEQGPKSTNSNIIAFAAETKHPNNRHPEQTFIFEGNTVINDHRGGQYFLIIRRENTKLQVKDNKFIGPGTLHFKENNKVFHRRHIAGLKPYPALPPGCKK